MRIYFDSNIFRKLKSTSKQFKQVVADAANALKPYFIFPFSEAHLSDLSTSEEPYRTEDLLLMESYVKDNFIHRDHVKKEINYTLSTPIEAYQQFSFPDPDDLQKDLDLSMEGLFDFEGGEQLRAVFERLMDLPVIPANDFDTSQLPDKVREFADAFKGIRSMRDAMNAIAGMGSMINDKGFVNLNRTLFEGYVNRDDYSFDQWSFEFDERMKDTTFGRSFTEIVEQMTTDQEKGDLYHSVLNTYVALEIFGVTQERSGKKQQLKKNSFIDLQKDAAHVFFASKSDYFVSDDIGVQQKAFITYKLHGIQTSVLSPADFIAQSAALLANEGDADWFMARVGQVGQGGEIIHRSEDGTVAVRSAVPPLFNYFNRIQFNTDAEDGSLQLFRTYDQVTKLLYSEIALLIEKLIKIFGVPLEHQQLDYSKHFRDYQPEEAMRAWVFSGTFVTLAFKKNGYGNRILVLGFEPLSLPKTESVDGTTAP